MEEIDKKINELIGRTISSNDETNIAHSLGVINAMEMLEVVKLMREALDEIKSIKGLK